MQTETPGDRITSGDMCIKEREVKWSYFQQHKMWNFISSKTNFRKDTYKAILRSKGQRGRYLASISHTVHTSKLDLEVLYLQHQRELAP